MNYSFFLFNCHLDCCLAENITHDQFKSLLKYDVTLASSSPVVKQCPYGKAEKVYRHCRERFPNSSEWTEVDFSQCKINLKSLNQVGECLQLLFCYYFYNYSYCCFYCYYHCYYYCCYYYCFYYYYCYYYDYCYYLMSVHFLLEFTEKSPITNVAKNDCISGLY